MRGYMWKHYIRNVFLIFYTYIYCNVFTIRSYMCKHYICIFVNIIFVIFSTCFGLSPSKIHALKYTWLIGSLFGWMFRNWINIWLYILGLKNVIYNKFITNKNTQCRLKQIFCNTLNLMKLSDLYTPINLIFECNF